MNRCTDVFDAEGVTSHQLSLGIKSGDKTTYIKGTAKDETNRSVKTLSQEYGKFAYALE